MPSALVYASLNVQKSKNADVCSAPLSPEIVRASVTSHVIASALGPSWMRTTAASPPGRCTVLPRMT